MMRRCLQFALIPLVMALSCVSAGFAQERSGLVSGGATEASGGGLIVRGSLGQPVVGVTSVSGLEAGQGFWFGLRDSGPSGVEQTHITGAGHSAGTVLDCFPNPASTTLHFRFRLPESGPITLRLYDALGRMRLELIDGERRGGIYLTETETDELDPGVYTAELRTAGERRTISVAVVK